MCTVQVASRRVVIISAIIMIAASLIGKWMAVLIMIPEPVIGGLFIILCGELFVTVSLCTYDTLMDTMSKVQR